ncbi:cytochrome c oxidase subunit 4 [Georgenia sp. Marseille-Q6866]
MAREHDRAPGEQSAEHPKPLGVEKWLFIAGVAFFLPVGLVYGFWTGWEPIGTVALLLLVGLYGLSGFYLALVARRVDPRPEDNPVSDVDEHAGEIGVYAPHSWWPLVLGVAAALAFAGVAVGWWIFGIGIAVGVVGLVGHTYEFSRGPHAH